MSEAPQIPFEDLLAALRREIENLNRSWMLWYRTFGAGSSRELYGVMQSKCEHAFRQIRWQLLRGVTLDLSRMCGDGPTTRVKGGAERTNLTVDSVLAAAKFESERLRTYVSTPASLAQGVVSGDEFARLRNRVIAHADALVLTGTDDHPDVEMSALEDAVDYLLTFLARIEAAVRNGSLGDDELEFRAAMDADADSVAGEFVRFLSDQELTGAER